MRYVTESRLFEEVLRPVTDRLHEVGYVGYVDVNCMVGADGTPWPLEFTMRFGWPHFNLCMALHKGDPAEWMANLLDGHDTLRVGTDVCVGVVMAMGDYPWNNLDAKCTDGFPLRGITPKTEDALYLTSVRMGAAPIKLGGRIEDRPVVVSAGSYVLIATGTGKTVQKAQASVYNLADGIGWPPHRTYRTDIGCRLEEDLPALQALGFAKGLEY